MVQRVLFLNKWVKGCFCYSMMPYLQQNLDSQLQFVLCWLVKFGYFAINNISQVFLKNPCSPGLRSPYVFFNSFIRISKEESALVISGDFFRLLKSMLTNQDPVSPLCSSVLLVCPEQWSGYCSLFPFLLFFYLR